jgi:hypothetical protein
MAVAAPVAGVDKKKAGAVRWSEGDSVQGKEGGHGGTRFKGARRRGEKGGVRFGGGERGAAWSRGRRGEKRGRRSGGRPAVARERWACLWAGPRRKGSRPGRKKRSGPSPE